MEQAGELGASPAVILLAFAALAVVGLAVIGTLIRRPVFLVLLLIVPVIACSRVADLGSPALPPPDDTAAASSGGAVDVLQGAPPLPVAAGGVAIAPAPALPRSMPAGIRRTLVFNGPRAEGLGDQCTAYALDRMHEATGLWLASQGDAGVWGRTAREAGWTVGTAPAARSILVMPPSNGYRYGIYTAGVLSRVAVHQVHGHVGWVERLDSSGNWALIADQNWTGNGARGYRWVWLKGAPVQFIYSDR
jgi:surface antigen